MPNIFKVGRTKRTPEERLDEANLPNTFKPPTPYTILFAKKVRNCIKSEKQIHEMLEDFRITKDREFFHTSREIIKNAFDSLEGRYWEPNRYEIQSIIHAKKIDNEVFYQIVWSGFYSLKDTTWESKQNLIEDGFADLIDDFEESLYFAYD